MNAPWQIILVGAFIEIVELCDATEVEIVGIVDNSQSALFLGRPILGTDNDAQEIIRRWPTIPVHVTPKLSEVAQKADCRLFAAWRKLRDTCTPRCTRVVLCVDRRRERDPGRGTRVFRVGARMRGQG